jgi:hypothetical protein
MCVLQGTIAATLCLKQYDAQASQASLPRPTWELSKHKATHLLSIKHCPAAHVLHPFYRHPPLIVPTAWCTTILWLSTTPLGVPVVPLV